MIQSFGVGTSLKRGRTMYWVGIRRRGCRYLWLSLGRRTRGLLLSELGDRLTGIDSVGVGFQVIEALCFFNLEGSPNEMTNRMYILVSRT